MPRLKSAILIDNYRFYPDRHQLTCADRSVRLTPKACQVLEVLIRNAGQTVTRDHLMHTVWNNELASDELLTRAITDLRKAFNDSFRKPEYIQTVPKVGYLLLKTVKTQNEDEDQHEADETADTKTAKTAGTKFNQQLIKLGLLTALLILIVATAAFFLNKQYPDSTAMAPQFPMGYQALPIRSNDGHDTAASVAPDGAFYTYTSRPENGQNRLMTRVLDSSYGVVLSPNDGSNYTTSAISHDGRTIAVVRYSEGDCGIYYIPAIGSALTKRLTDCDPAWSALDWLPDGTSVAFTSTEKVNQAQPIRYINDAEETHDLTRPPAGAVDSIPRFSPDGESIAFIRTLGNQQQLIVSNNGQETFVSDARGCCQGLDWLPDGKSLLVSRYTAGRSRLWVVNIQSEIWNLVPDSLDTAEPVVDAHSGLVAFTRQTIERSIWRRPIADIQNQFAPFVFSARSDHSPAISPNRAELAFVSDRSGEDQLWIKNMVDGTERQLTNFTNVLLTRPSWSPDSQHLLVNAYSGADSYLYHIDLSKDDNNYTTVQISNHQARRGHWRNNARNVVYFCQEKDATQWDLCETLAESPNEVTLLETNIPEAIDCTYITLDSNGKELLLYVPADNPSKLIAYDFENQASNELLDLGDSQQITLLRSLGHNAIVGITALDNPEKTELVVTPDEWSGAALTVNDLEPAGFISSMEQIETDGQYVYLTKQNLTAAYIELMQYQNGN